MTAREAIAFVRRHGVVLESARGDVPSLAEAVVGAPIRGSWWAHPRGRELFRIFGAVRECPDVLVCRLVDGKITFVHRRLWPALYRAARRFPKDRLAWLNEEHTPSGRHVTKQIPFPKWVPGGAREKAETLDEAKALELLGTKPVRADVADLDAGTKVRAALAAWGAPLETRRPRGEIPTVEETLVAGAQLARLDGSVARSLPVCLWKNRDRVDFDRLLEEARRWDERHTVGFFLSLTGVLAGDRRFEVQARRFRDRRIQKTQGFFLTDQPRFARALARGRTPAVAKAWKFTMNMSLETFASTFRKFVTGAG